MTPGQLGPMIRMLDSGRERSTFTMSKAGTPSVMQMAREMPASAASNIASAAPGAGTKIIEVSAPVCLTAVSTASKTGTASWNLSPPLPGVTPATMLVPYSSICMEWNVALLAGDALNQDTRGLVYQDAHAERISLRTFVASARLSTK